MPKEHAAFHGLVCVMRAAGTDLVFIPAFLGGFPMGFFLAGPWEADVIIILPLLS
jgi:hypothetical protein